MNLPVLFDILLQPCNIVKHNQSFSLALPSHQIPLAIFQLKTKTVMPLNHRTSFRQLDRLQINDLLILLLILNSYHHGKSIKRMILNGSISLFPLGIEMRLSLDQYLKEQFFIKTRSMRNRLLVVNRIGLLCWFLVCHYIFNSFFYIFQINIYLLSSFSIYYHLMIVVFLKWI